MTDKESFDKLIESSPPLPEATHVLTGTLFQAANPEQFTLVLSDGKSLTLYRSAVRSHKVVAESAGRKVVRIEVNPDDVALDLPGDGASPQFGPGGTGSADIAGTGVVDNPKPIFDKVFHDSYYTGPYDFWPWPHHHMTPFGLATAHQSPAAAAMAAAPPNSFKILHDSHTVPYDTGPRIHDMIPPPF